MIPDCCFFVLMPDKLCLEWKPIISEVTHKEKLRTNRKVYNEENYLVSKCIQDFISC